MRYGFEQCPNQSFRTLSYGLMILSPLCSMYLSGPGTVGECDELKDSSHQCLPEIDIDVAVSNFN